MKTTVRLPLTNSDAFAVIDADDADMVLNVSSDWFMNPDGRVAVTRRAAVAKGVFYLHQLIMNAQKGEIVTHKNGNLLDNRKDNLAVITQQIKTHRKRKKKGATSKYYGVCRVKGTTHWQTGITVNRVRHQAGHFDKEIDAARAYDALAYRFFGPLANLNFPEEYPDNPDSVAFAPPNLRSDKRTD